jgi:hypothetical protein
MALSRHAGLAKRMSALRGDCVAKLGLFSQLIGLWFFAVVLYRSPIEGGAILAFTLGRRMPAVVGHGRRA